MAPTTWHASAPLALAELRDGFLEDLLSPPAEAEPCLPPEASTGDAAMPQLRSRLFAARIRISACSWNEPEAAESAESATPTGGSGSPSFPASMGRSGWPQPERRNGASKKGEAEAARSDKTPWTGVEWQRPSKLSKLSKEAATGTSDGSSEVPHQN